MEKSEQHRKTWQHGKIYLTLLIIPLFFIIALGWHMIDMPGTSYTKPLKPLTKEQQQIRDQVKVIINKLATQIGERNIWHPEKLNEAANYIESTLKSYGYKVQVQSFISRGQNVKNIEATLPSKLEPNKIVVVGAHYDSVLGSPGANDNASGVAALLELARLLKNEKLEHSVRFVAFVNEEPPFYRTKEMGSYHYATIAHNKKENIIAMLSLETMGYFSNNKYSQAYPLFLRWFYPNQANFIGFIGNFKSYDLLRKSIQAFRQYAQFPSEGIAGPAFIRGVDWSDHWSFWRYGYKAIMITDTAFYRYPHYHTWQDTADKINYDHLARVVSGLVGVVRELAN